LSKKLQCANRGRHWCGMGSREGHGVERANKSRSARLVATGDVSGKKITGKKQKINVAGGVWRKHKKKSQVSGKGEGKAGQGGKSGLRLVN